MMKNFLKIFVLLITTTLFAQTSKVSVETNSNGMKLVVNGEDFMINGMNWDYIPIGTNYSYSLWNQSDDVIKAALDAEMGLLKNMGVNAIRQYTGIQPKWIQYIYENYGIYTMLNHSFGRYGLTVNGVWIAKTNYNDTDTKEFLMSEVKNLAETYKNTPGLLMYLLGNENNYGLVWEGAETEDIPVEKDDYSVAARYLYRAMNEATLAMKAIDTSHPIAICNGDLGFLDIVAEECKDIDIYGTNMYRGVSFGDAFNRVKKELNKPFMFTEFGADAFNAINNAEDQKSQAYYMVGNWKEIYENAAGLGKANNSIGGFTFQFSDGWWKFGQTKNLDVHDNNASWANGGYKNDFKKGQNNMNEEWFGICAKGTTNARGLYDLYPRAAYYALKNVHQLNPYEKGVNTDFINNYFNNIQLMDAVLKARGDKAALGGGNTDKIRLSNLRAEFTTYNTGGRLISTPNDTDQDANAYPNQLGFDHMQSYYIGVEGNPAPNMRAEVNFNILGNVAGNPIDEIFYENRGRPQVVNTDDGNITINDPNRVQVYNAEFEWNGKIADVRGFYRTGHYHWGYEGDFFGLYPEANYGPNLDIYNGEVLGAEIDGKGALNGLKAAFGPQLWWGANPAILLKYNKTISNFDVTGIYHEDIANAPATSTSIAIPLPKTRRATLHIKRDFGNLGLELGGIWGGQPLNGREFNVVSTDSAVVDKVNTKDNWGGKIKLTYQNGRLNAYAQAAAMGIVANGGADQTKTFTGWRLKDSGSGNQTNVLAGFTYSVGNLQIAPNFLWQKPIVGAIPNNYSFVNGNGQTVGVPLRNVQDDPFAVRANRETTAGELLLTFDPTPGTWMYEWNNDMAEDAKFAMNLGFVYRHHPTAQDASIAFDDARNSYALPNAAPTENLWEAHTRIVSKLNPDLGFIGNFYYGNGQANGSGGINDENGNRLIKRFGGDIRAIYKKVKATAFVKVNDWGPFDYHRDFNLTYPLQFMLDVSTSVGKPNWFILPNTRIGIRGTWRSMDKYSPRYSPNAALPFSPPTISTVGFPNGNEWEIKTYVHINIGK